MFVVGRAEKGHRGNQSAGARAGYDVKHWLFAGCRPAVENAGCKGTVTSSTRKCQDVEPSPIQGRRLSRTISEMFS